MILLRPGKFTFGEKLKNILNYDTFTPLYMDSHVENGDAILYYSYVATRSQLTLPSARISLPPKILELQPQLLRNPLPFTTYSKSYSS